MNRRLIYILLVSLIALISACRVVPVQNVKDSPIPASTSQQSVKKAILRAGASLGWQMKETGPGHIVGIIHVRTHMAKVDINYHPGGYDIVYNNSENLKYDGDGNIHGNYNSWVQNLDQRIQVDLSGFQ